MKAKFIGDHHGHGPEIAEFFGITFKKGCPTEVSDPAVIAKLSGNSHFICEGKAPTPEAETTETTGDATDREALAAQYVEKFGKKPHYRWTAEKIAEKLNADHD